MVNVRCVYESCHSRNASHICHVPSWSAAQVDNAHGTTWRIFSAYRGTVIGQFPEQQGKWDAFGKCFCLSSVFICRRRQIPVYACVGDTTDHILCAGPTQAFAEEISVTTVFNVLTELFHRL